MELLLKQISVWLNYTQELLILALVLARTMPMVVQTPFLGGKLAPTEVKIGLGLLFTVVLWPVARGALHAPLPTTPIPFLLLMGKEIFVGLALGFVNSLAFSIMEMAGRWIDTARGSSLAEVMEPHSGQRSTPFGDLYYQLFLVVFVGLGAHAVFFEAFFYSFASIPLNVGLPSPDKMGLLADYVTRLTADVLLASVLLSAPVLAAVLVTDVVFGILNRVAPQLNAYFMSMPVKAMAGVILVIVVLDALVTRLGSWALWSLRGVERTLELLAR
jgi:flagellar biosynthetic protein FliR